MRAVISVYDKTGLVPFAQSLRRQGVEIFSTGGTQREMQDAGVEVKSVSALTGFPEILDGRVKTLHPVLYGGILARRDLPDHMAQLYEHNIGPIDIVVCNLYPFVETVSKAGVTLEEALENIDIGGPTMVRASAKNFPHVIVIVDPDDYSLVADKLSSGGLDLNERKRLARKAFQHVALYDTAISGYLTGDDESLGTELTFGGAKLQDLRYGENPHQRAAFYTDVLGGGTGIAGTRQLWGKELSFNNIVDADAAWNVASDFGAPTVAVIKHTNPCGLASHDDLTEAYKHALAGDPVSAFGGIVAFNRPLTKATAEEVSKVFYEIVIAPEIEEAALDILKKRKNLRVLTIGAPSKSPALEYRRVGGGLLVQSRDTSEEDLSGWEIVTRQQPTAEQLSDLAFAWKAAKHVKSNAIVLARDEALLGMGAGQPNRVTSVHLALRAAGDKARGSVLASDAFFPFPDNIELAAEGGVVAIIQPGGSIRDQEVIDTADQAGIAMVFTGARHFKH